MVRADLRASYQDVAFTTATPFESDGSTVDHTALVDNISKLYDSGARQFVPCGNTGEYYSLTDEERVDVVASHVEAVGPEATITAGAAGSLVEVERLASAYEDAGADALMVMHPDHTYVHETGLKEYYHRICDSTDLGVVIYKRGPQVTRDVIADVSERENLVAVKFAVNDIKEFSQTVDDVPGELTWVNGIAERYALAFAIEGATGYTTGIGNFVPEATLALHAAVESRDWTRARRIQQSLRPYEDLREQAGEENNIAAANNVSAVKYGMDLAGYRGGVVRSPLVELSEEDKSRADDYYRQIQSEPLHETA
ncbi:dihydrodipicolinate synthase family protein [Haloprofundus halobius]|uniref:dihydrodipicolinate synthase family protein n=1 Tax=Haloprofundus halobius TaxID=2876194 RepID=UPI001CCAF1F7|nr:dihydrodipicolinate synthase family protein [Haloprofundus halobius]